VCHWRCSNNVILGNTLWFHGHFLRHPSSWKKWI
jgi:hypothetical protein